MHKYRIYPTKQQQSLLAKIVIAHTDLYNTALYQKIEQYKATKNSDSTFTQITNLIKPFKLTENGKLCNYSSLQQTIRRLHKNFNAIYNRRGGRPRFKKEISIEYSKHTDGWTLTNKLRIQSVGKINIFLHRPINGLLKNLVIKRDNDKYYACINCEVGGRTENASTKAVGIDFGLKTFLVTSDGQQIQHPQPFKKSLKRLAQVNRQIKKAKDITAKLKKKKLARRKIYAKIANQRRDFAHKLSRQFVRNYGLIAVEDLNLKELTNTNISNVNRKYSDVAVGMFYKFLSYKAEIAGRQFIKVKAAYTSQTCNKCNRDLSLELKDRQFTCDCGHTADRDENAAKNILDRALLAIGLYGVKSITEK